MRFEDLSVGDTFERTVEAVRAADIKLTAALLQDPYPPHFDPRRADELGYPGLLNQGPANIAYMLQPIVRELESPSEIRRFDTRFHNMVFADEGVTATATVEAKTPAEDGGVVEFALELTKENGETAVDGTAAARFGG